MLCSMTTMLKEDIIHEIIILYSLKYNGLIERKKEYQRNDKKLCLLVLMLLITFW